MDIVTLALAKKYADQLALGTSEERVQEIITEEVNKIIGDVTEEFDTLEEVENWILDEEQGGAYLLKRVEEIPGEAYAESLSQLIINREPDKDGVVILYNDVAHAIDIEQDISFVLPSYNSNKRTKITVFADIKNPVSIDWGTTYFIDGIIPVITTGLYTFTFEFDGQLWMVRTESKHSSNTVQKSIRVLVNGEYEGINYWENATYNFFVTNGVEADNGWISNGEYKFMYYPKTGQIKKAASTAAFALEENKSIPEYIVIPFSIEAFNTGYNQYEAKNITTYAANGNSGIFRGNANANTTIIIPEGTTTIGSFTYAQNRTANTQQTYILPSTLTTIGREAFASMSSGGLYTSITIPASVTTFGQGAFARCKFKTMTFLHSEAPAVTSNVFSGISSGLIVLYPETATGYEEGSAFRSAFPDTTTFMTIEEYSEI